jgi:hypothetical protein
LVHLLRGSLAAGDRRGKRFQACTLDHKDIVIIVEARIWEPSPNP